MPVVGGGIILVGPGGVQPISTAAPACNLNGVPLLGSAPVRWVIREGVAPTIEIFQIRSRDRGQLEGGRPVTLTMKVGNDELIFRELWVLDFPPGPNENLQAVRVADRRWWWPYVHVLHRFNMRRRVGTRRAIGPTQELQPTVYQFAYAPYSLKDGTHRWTAEEVLQRVLKSLLEDDRGENKTPQVPPFPRGLPIEDLEIDDQGDAAVARALSYLPGAGIFVDPQGVIRCFQRTDDASAAIRAFGREAVGEGHITRVQKTLIRPRKVRVLFSVEAEVRFDYKEATGQTTAVLTEDAKEIERRMDNVLPVPDFSVTLPIGEVSQGTWITIDQAFSAWGTLPNGATLDHRRVRRAMMPFLDLWNACEIVGFRDPRVDWAARLAAVQSHYRTTFRIPQRWMDRSLALRAYRSTTIDPATGSRGPAMAYCDYTVVTSARLKAAIKSISPFVEVPGFPKSGLFDSDTKPAPAIVSVLDEDQGVIHLDWKSDPARLQTMFLPGLLDNMKPSTDIALADREGKTVVWDGIPKDASEVPQLASGHQVAAILTLIPAAPNSKAQLFAVEVSPEEPDFLAATPAITHVRPKAEDPVMEVRIPPGLETCRVAWVDSQADLIAQLFGVGRAADNDQRPEIPPGLIQNLERVILDTSGASLRNIAIAAAAKVYTDFADRHNGTAAFPWQDASEQLMGTMQEISFEVDPSGAPSVRVHMAEEPPKFSLFSFLDPGTRKVVMRLVS